MRRILSAKTAALVVVALSLFAAVPIVAAQDAATNEPRPLEVTLERLASLLTRLETELAAVDRPAASKSALRKRWGSSRTCSRRSATSARTPRPPGASPGSTLRSIASSRCLRRSWENLATVLSAPRRG